MSGGNPNHGEHGRFSSGGGGNGTGGAAGTHAGHAAAVPGKTGDQIREAAKTDPAMAAKYGGTTVQVAGNSTPHYNAGAVNRAIASNNRSGPKIGAKEGRAIHALLRGRH